MSKVIEGLLYSESHEWVKVEDGIAVIGVSDYAQAEMGDITYVDLPSEGDEVEAGEEFMPAGRSARKYDFLSLQVHRLEYDFVVLWFEVPLTL